MARCAAFFCAFSMSNPSIVNQIAERQQRIVAAVKSSDKRLAVPSGHGWAYPLRKDALGIANPAAGVDAVDESEMSVTAIISVEIADRDGDVVESQGCLDTLDRYARNPAVFFNHQQFPLPIGKAESPDGKLAVQVEDKRILATTYFSQHTQDAQDVFALIKDGFIRMTSIGFMPYEAYRLEAKAGTSRDDVGEQIPGWRFVRWELLEYSFVGVPSNPFAEVVRQHLSRGRIAGKTISPALRKALEPFCSPATPWACGWTPEVKSDKCGGEGGTPGRCPEGGGDKPASGGSTPVTNAGSTDGDKAGASKPATSKLLHERGEEIAKKHYQNCSAMLGKLESGEISPSDAFDRIGEMSDKAAVANNANFSKLNSKLRDQVAVNFGADALQSSEFKAVGRAIVGGRDAVNEHISDMVDVVRGKATAMMEDRMSFSGQVAMRQIGDSHNAMVQAHYDALTSIADAVQNFRAKHGKKAMSKKWGKARSKKPAVKADAPVDPTALLTDDDHARGSDIQSIRVPKSDLFPDAAAAAKWVVAHDFDGSAPVAEMTGDVAGPVAWTFEQFPVADCQPESAREEDLGDGVTGVVCQARIEETPEPEPEKAMGCGCNGKAYTGTATDRNGNTIEIANGRVIGTKGKTMNKADEPADMPQEVSPDAAASEAAVEADIPDGAAFLQGLIAQRESIQDYIETSLPRLEQPKVADLGATTLEEVATELQEIADFGKQLYPDVEFTVEQAAPTDMPPSDEGGEPAKSKRRLNPKQLARVRFLGKGRKDAMGGERSMPRGAAFLQGLIAAYEACMDYCQDATMSLEHPDVLTYAEELLTNDKAKVEEIAALATDIYPDAGVSATAAVDSDAAAGDEEAAGEEGKSAKKRRRKADGMTEGDGSEGGDTVPDDDAEEEAAADEPKGIKLLRGLTAGFTALLETCKVYMATEGDSNAEEDELAKACMDDTAAKMEAITGYAEEKYPDAFQPAEAKAEDEEDEDTEEKAEDGAAAEEDEEEEDKAAVKARKPAVVKHRGMSKKSRAVCRDAAECLSDIVSDVPMKGTYKIACKHHADALLGLAKEEEKPETEDEDEEGGAEEKAATVILERLKSAERKQNELLFSLTGREELLHA